MSVQAISWALDHRVHSVTEKVILLVLANYANEYGISWPSQRTLAENAACDERTVRRTLVSLEARGVIRRIARRRGNDYAPTPGHLLALATPILEARRFWARLAAQLAAEAGHGNAAEPDPQRHPKEDRA